jgi:UDP-N-acetylglucosamine acyltransferase
VIGYIDPRACIGMPPEHRDHRWAARVFHWPVIADSAIVEAFASVDSGLERPTTVCAEAYVMKHAHVGHDAYIGPGCNIAPHVVIGGHAHIGAFSKLGIGAVIRPRIDVGHHAVIGAGAVVVKDVPAGETWVGNPASRLRRDGWVREALPDTWTGSQEEYELWVEAFGPGYRP